MFGSPKIRRPKAETLTWHSQNQNEIKLRHRPESQFRETRGLLVLQCQCSCLRRCL